MNDIGVLEKKISRESIMDFEELIKQQETSVMGDSDVCPITSSFSDGIYVREMFAPKGRIIVGKIINHKHHLFLMSGEVTIITEQGRNTIKGPCHMVYQAGTKRILCTLTDVVLVNIHPNVTNTQDVDQIERQVISPSYKDYERHIQRENGLVKKLKNKLIKLLS